MSRQGPKYLIFPVLSTRNVDTIEKALVWLAQHPTWSSPTAQRHIESAQESLQRASARPGQRP